jgi:primosomal protein N' (replication factor Y)
VLLLLFVSIVFPIAISAAYTYSVPSELQSKIVIGKRVEAPIKNKLYSGIIIAIDTLPPSQVTQVRNIVSVLDDFPIVNNYQLDFWKWMSEYYCSTLGEVMNAALPTSLKLESETKVIAHPDFDQIDVTIDDDEYMIAEAISIQNELTLGQIQDILNRKTIYPVINSLLEKGYISIKEELIEKYKPKMIPTLNLTEEYFQGNHIEKAFEKVSRSDAQTRALLAFMQLGRDNQYKVPSSEVNALAGVDSTVIKALIKKNILELTNEQKSRANMHYRADIDLQDLSPTQTAAVDQIKQFHVENKPVLIHGITGSGKTRIYIEFIRDIVRTGKQVLLLLPEIALTYHILERLRSQIEYPILAYHSSLNNNERVDIWNEVAQGAKIVVAARSGLFLPFTDLGLIIIDEEHDPSYKQQEPSPRYNARDGALYLAKTFDAKVILGSATPSLESYYNTIKSKFGLVKILDRHGESVLPQIDVIDLKKSYKDKSFDGILSPQLKEAIHNSLEKKEQILLFKNRRGYAPTLRCDICGWYSECAHCDVHLTLHKGINMLKCHYCGSKTKKPIQCPSCGSTDLAEQGFGTEKIEEYISEVFPTARTVRVDMDAVRSKLSFDKIMHEFENKDIDIIIGTQMITKGLDFSNLALVGVINADGLLRYPNFRSNERGFQLLTQVAGRAGRRSKQGKVVIQSYSPEHPVLQETAQNLYGSFYQREMSERFQYKYPPYFRLILVDFEHKNAENTLQAAQAFVSLLSSKLGNRIIGPSEPPIHRLRGLYIQNVIVKFENDSKVAKGIKALLLDAVNQLKQIKAFKPIRVKIDVDPY